MKHRVILGLQTIGLGAPARERIEHNDFRSRLNAAGRLVFLPKKNPEIVQQFRRERGGLCICDQIFAVADIPRCFRQNHAANALILRVLVQRFISDADGVLLPKLVRDSSRKISLSLRAWHVRAYFA